MKNKINLDNYGETIFYLGNCISKEFNLERKWLILDNYYDFIKDICIDFIVKGYDKLNEGLYYSVTKYINDYKDKIKDKIKNSEIIEEQL